MILARLLDPASKLATAKALSLGTAASSLAPVLGLGEVDADELYAALDWLVEQQPTIEAGLAKRHLKEGTLVLYDVSSSWLEGRCCPLAQFGHSRDRKSSKLQIVYGLLCAADGCPVAIEVFEGNTGDPTTLSTQVAKLKERFVLRHIVLVGDRGMITQARIDADLRPNGLDWITALRAPAIRGLVEGGALQLSLFDERDMAAVTSPDYPDERLVVCRNPALAAERARKREDLLQAAERDMAAIQQAVERTRRPLRGIAKIARKVGAVLDRRHMAKHFDLDIADDRFVCTRKAAAIAAEAALDGLYAVRARCPPTGSTMPPPSPPTRASPASSVPSVRSKLSTSTSAPSFTIARRACAPTSSSACWPITSNGTCAIASRRCSMTTTIAPLLKPCAPAPSPRPALARRPCQG